MVLYFYPKNYLTICQVMTMLALVLLFIYFFYKHETQIMKSSLTLTEKAANIQKLLETQELHPIYRKRLLNTLYELTQEIRNLSQIIINEELK